MKTLSLIFVLSMSVVHNHLLSSAQERTDSYGYSESALRIAAKNGDVGLMQELIHAGADVNDVWGCDWPHAGRTILAEAIDSGSAQAVKLLLDSGADIERLSEVPTRLNILRPATRNVISLSYAVMVNAPMEIIQVLIQYSKDLNIPDIYHDWTPYKIAAYYNNTQAMEALQKALALRGQVSLF